MNTDSAMRVGILGRHRAMLDAAMGLARERGFEALGTTEDAEALAWIDSGRIDALSIGGGVEAGSRAILLTACADAGVVALEVFGLDGPNGLDAALARLRTMA